jgi:voltage-gated potassium channel Kch
VRYRWVVIGLAGLVGVALGYIGLDRYYHAQSRGGASVLDLVYDDLKLLGFGGAPSPPLNVPLEIARFLLPVVVLSGALTGLLALFRDRYEQARLPFLRRHVLVVGLGDKGLAFVQAMRATGARVVAIDADARNPNVTAARDVGATVLFADATDEGVLGIAGVRRARHLVATADDATNAEVALQAERLTRSRRGGPMLQCLAHVVDADLCELLKLQTLEAPHGGGLRVDFFNFYEEAARIAVERSALDDRRVVIIGDSPLVEQIVLRVVQSRDAQEPRRTVVIVGPDADAELRAITGRHRHLADSGALQALAVGLDAPSLRDSRLLQSADGPAAVFVCTTDDGAGVEIALALKRRARATSSRIVVCAARSAGLASVLTGEDVGADADASEGRPLASVTVLALAHETCTSDLVNGGISEILSRAVHEDYLRRRRVEAGVNASDPALLPWDQLLPDLQESNRSQAAHIGVKLQTIGCDLVPASEQAAPFEFTAEEVDRLARMEHDRWVAERRRSGWTLGDHRDPERRTSPDLVPWEQLSEPTQAKDREAVERIPEVVGLVGFRVVRLAPTVERAPD